MVRSIEVEISSHYPDGTRTQGNAIGAMVEPNRHAHIYVEDRLIGWVDGETGVFTLSDEERDG